MLDVRCDQRLDIDFQRLDRSKTALNPNSNSIPIKVGVPLHSPYSITIHYNLSVTCQVSLRCDLHAIGIRLQVG